MNVRVKKVLTLSLCAAILLCSCSSTASGPEAQATKVLDRFFKAAIAGDMKPAMELIESAWFKKKADELDMDVENYTPIFAGFYSEELKALGLTSYTFENKKKVSATEWEIDVRQEVKDGFVVETFIMTKIGSKWYIAGKNFESVPPTGATDVLDMFFKAAMRGDMKPAMELVESAWFDKMATELYVDAEEYKALFAEAYSEELKSLGLTSYSFQNEREVTETEWEIDVKQLVAEGTAIESFIIIKVGDKWYVAGKNFDKNFN